MRPTTALITLLAALAALGGVAGASHDALRHLSVGEVNGNGSFPAFFAGASADGSRVFLRTAEQLVSDDTDSSADVYERAGGQTTRVSAGQVNGNGNFPAGFAGASGDGSRVFFETDERLVSADTDLEIDVYERSAGSTRLVSAGAINGNGLFDARFAGASGDGTRVFFRTSEKLVSGDTDASQDIYQRAGGTTKRVSAGAISGNDAFNAVFAGASADGSRVFFSTEEQLVAADTDDSQDAYERSGGTTTLVSAGAINGNGAFDAAFRGASADGTRILFQTQEKLVGADADGSIDIYERSGGTTTRSSSGNAAFDAAFSGLSADGSRVFFRTQEKLVGTDTDSSIDVYERSGGSTRLVSAGAINGNGAFDAAFRGTSADGSRVFFDTSEQLVAADTDGSLDIYERSGGTTRLVSAGQVNGNGAFSAAFQGASADGARVFFTTVEQLVSADTDGAFFDIYERSGGTTSLVSPGNGAFKSFFRGASADGSAVFFETDEKVIASDEDSSQDVYGAYKAP